MVKFRKFSQPQLTPSPPPLSHLGGVCKLGEGRRRKEEEEEGEEGDEGSPKIYLRLQEGYTKRLHRITEGGGKKSLRTSSQTFFFNMSQFLI